MTRIGVMHVIDSLLAGGAETMCVQLANALPRERYEVHLCSTRRGGPLEARIALHVRLMLAGRKGRYDLAALLRIRDYVRRNHVRILHAHSTSVFAAAAVSLLARGTTVIWHDHYGGEDEDPRSAALYRALRTAIWGVIVVNRRLQSWATGTLGFPQNRVWLVPNFATSGSGPAGVELPGQPGFRIVQVANVRPPKDHGTMLRAMARIVSEMPQAHLLLAGQCGDDTYAQSVRRLALELNLASHVTFLGSRPDVGAVLSECAVGVLSSTFEGLPVALLEYGAASLGVVCTRVGDCPAVLEGGSAGKLVDSGDSDAMAEAVIELLRDRARRSEFGRRLRNVVERDWSQSAAVRKVTEIYEKVLA
ncbi:MAG: glycosyltransferase [Dehalococcoidales bacterium]|nr:glycosyltransferase [Dehalococcoidales bacterium]